MEPLAPLPNVESTYKDRLKVIDGTTAESSGSSLRSNLFVMGSKSALIVCNAEISRFAVLKSWMIVVISVSIPEIVLFTPVKLFCKLLILVSC